MTKSILFGLTLCALAASVVLTVVIFTGGGL